MEIGIEIRITLPPNFIFFAAIIVPISEIAPTIKYEMPISNIKLLVLEVENITEKNMMPSRRYIIPPIPLRINPIFLLKPNFFFKNSSVISLLSLSSTSFS